MQNTQKIISFKDLQKKLANNGKKLVYVKDRKVACNMILDNTDPRAGIIIPDTGWIHLQCPPKHKTKGKSLMFVCRKDLVILKSRKLGIS